MNVIRVTIDESADVSFLQKMIENIKGVVRTTHERSVNNEDSPDFKRWVDDLRSIKDCIDHSKIDISDERTKHILSK